MVVDDDGLGWVTRKLYQERKKCYIRTWVAIGVRMVRRHGGYATDTVLLNGGKALMFWDVKGYNNGD